MIRVRNCGTSESDENIKKGMAAGAFAYIDKSEAKANLIPAVEKLFNKSSEHPAGIRILVVDDSSSVRMMQNGAAAFIIKPFNIEQVMMTLNKIVSYEFLLLLKEKERLDGEQKLLIAGITSLVKALEARDQYTRGHSERVSRILAGLVKHSGGTNYDIERAQIAGRLHDIGKIGIRDNVLLKPGRLSDDEFDHIKQHPAIGASIIQSIPSISDILPVVYSHHERMDGKGYPQRMKDISIPFMGTHDRNRRHLRCADQR